MRHDRILPTQVQNPPSMTADDVGDLVRWAYKLTGISLTDRKQDFLSGRLSKRLAATGTEDFASYRRLLAADDTEHAFFREALTTHTTSFFRESAQFDWLREAGFAELLGADAMKRKIVIWSAACSTGQEGYTALMVADQVRERALPRLDARLVGTDISRAVLKVAARAIYLRDDIKGIPAELRPRVLLSSRTDDGRYRIVPELRNRASWRCANLVSGEGLRDLHADIAFLRNVLIYFDPETRDRVVATVVDRLRPGGFLLVGHTEGAQASHPGLRQVRPSIFQKDPL